MLEARLAKERELLLNLSERNTFIDVTEVNNFGETFLITYHVKGLAWLSGVSAPTITNFHQLELYFHERFPRFPPRFLWKTEIFHPNILPPQKNGTVCIGGWAPSETAEMLVLRIAEMIQYKQYNLNDPLNIEAANWAREHEHLFPVDKREVY